MKPFDLKAALAGAPVVTRDGREVQWLKHDPEANLPSRILARIGESGCHVPLYENGFLWSNRESQTDLFMATVKREGWVNLHTCTTGQPGVVAFSGNVWATKELAETLQTPSKIAAIRIEWEE